MVTNTSSTYLKLSFPFRWNISILLHSSTFLLRLPMVIIRRTGGNGFLVASQISPLVLLLQLHLNRIGVDLLPLRTFRSECWTHVASITLLLLHLITHRMILYI